MLKRSPHARPHPLRERRPFRLVEPRCHRQPPQVRPKIRLDAEMQRMADGAALHGWPEQDMTIRRHLEIGQLGRGVLALQDETEDRGKFQAHFWKARGVEFAVKRRTHHGQKYSLQCYYPAIKLGLDVDYRFDSDDATGKARQEE